MGRNKNKDKNIDEREVIFQLYFNPYYKDSYTRIYDVILETYNRTYDAIYKDIKENPKVVSDNYLEKAKELISNKYISEYDDGSQYYEAIENYVADRMQEHSLMHYQFVLMSLSNLYQVFEQQLRKWLFEEMTHHHNEYINQIKFTLDRDEDYGEFYNKFGALQSVLKEMELTFTMPTREVTELDILLGNDKDMGKEIPIVETEIWATIRECSLISNTFKHGSGRSASELYKIKPKYFEKVNQTKLMNLYRTTNLEEVLSVDKINFEKFVHAMKDFWGKLKTHQSGSLMLDIDISLEKEVESTK